MSHADNGNVAAGHLKPTSSSNEDLSEYTDADESISAPTEVLAEFLSAVMLKDYETALKYCKCILQYEPNNVTAKEFYPLILDKLDKPYNTHSRTSDADSNSNSSYSEPEENESSNSSSDTSSEDDDEDEEEEEEDEEEEEEENADATSSYSSLEDEEAESDQLSALAARYKVDNMDLGNGNKIIFSGKSSHKWDSKSDLSNSTSGGSGMPPYGTSSDSESPTEPVSQQTIAMLRAKVVPPKH